MGKRCLSPPFLSPLLRKHLTLQFSAAKEGERIFIQMLHQTHENIQLLMDDFVLLYIKV